MLSSSWHKMVAYKSTLYLGVNVTFFFRCEKMAGAAKLVPGG